ncbi:LacI family DNA-binding transcriptional regulator [Bifidobacterium sp. CP2]|uniref:LacI family DNA-binding transcriptional regulator n=1 Tax=Bifidobacterium sp. CP2 TaxID=2809025 RepID=UPI001BDC3C3B|nr:LacI family DNA-binding transcriptional regulator [Bifidobacterium sp. CP2]MBT1181033.1 LacI family DNA-binding transcriptional regulator [Bifidobacterium sp. CP2]
MNMKGGMVATLKDVAREAGVSVTTASAALRGGDGVKPATREKVLKAAAVVKYSANASARFLKQGKSDVIAFVVPDLENPYFADLAWAISKEAARHGLQTIVQQTNASVAVERDFLKRVNSPMCDGLILNLHNVPESELRSLIGNHPAVLFEDYSPHPLYDNVALPLEPAFKAAFTYLKQRGYEHAAIVGGQRLSAGQFSAEGRNTGIELAKKAMTGVGLGVETDIVPCEWTVDGGLKAAAMIAQNDLGYDVLFCMNDLLAFGLMRGFASMGIQVPRDKAVFGFDGVSPASYTSPLLSTIAVDFDGMAKSAVTMLVDRMGGDVSSPVRRETVGFHLVRGESA